MNEMDIILEFDKNMKSLNSGINPLRKCVMGYYGEVLVANEFKKRGFNIQKKGGQAGYDLIVNGMNVEVRASEVKIERAFPKKITAWGWKLQTRDKNKNPKPIKYDFIILVKLDKDWKNHQLFMFSKKEVEDMKYTYFRGYQTVARVIYLFTNGIEEAINPENNKYDMITSQCIEFNKNPSSFLIDWDKFSV